MRHPELAGKRILGVTLQIYDVLGWRQYDLKFTYTCDCCGNTGSIDWWNVSHEDIAGVASLKGSALWLVTVDDPERLTWDESDGAYDPQGNWCPWPVYQLEINDELDALRIDRKAQGTSVANQTLILSMWFVECILGRRWKPTDYKTQVTAHAKQVLADYSLDDVCGCLEATKDGMFGPIDPTYITIIRKMEPPLIAQWQAYKTNPPPEYMVESYREWKERVDRRYDPADFNPADEYPEAV